jgi:hypothetical protein
MQPGSADRDVEITRPGVQPDVDVLLVELEKPQKVDKIRLHEAQAAQVSEFLFAETQAGQTGHFAADFVGQRGEVHAFVATPELVFDLRSGKVMQDDLHHGELVQVGIEQRLDDHGGRGSPERGNCNLRAITGLSADVTPCLCNGQQGKRTRTGHKCVPGTPCAGCSAAVPLNPPARRCSSAMRMPCVSTAHEMRGGRSLFDA